MTDPDLIAKKLAVIETCLADLRTLADPGALSKDIRMRRFVEHTLQIAIQSALDVASHIASDNRWGEPTSNRDLFAKLREHGWIEATLGQQLENMAGFRNVLVHGYEDVDLAIVKDILINHLTDLAAFVHVIRART